MDGVDAVGEEDEPGLVEAARTLPRLEGVQRGGDDQEEGEEEPGDEACVHTCNDSPCNTHQRYGGAMMSRPPPQ